MGLHDTSDVESTVVLGKYNRENDSVVVAVQCTSRQYGFLRAMLVDHVRRKVCLITWKAVMHVIHCESTREAEKRYTGW